MKTYRMRSRANKGSREAWINFNLEFDGERAFAVWETIQVGNYALKARLEIDPGQLRPGEEEGDFVYRGQLVLPTPHNN